MNTKLTSILILSGLFLFIFTGNVFSQFTFYEVTNQPVLSYGNPGDWDDGSVWFPNVIKDGDTLRMWYEGLDDIVWNPTTVGVGYAWSLNGINWIKDSIHNPVLSADLDWELGWQTVGALIKDADTFKMWYSAAGLIGYATSADGISWNKHPDPVLSYGPEGDWDDAFVSAGTIIKEADEYKMWFEGGRAGFPQIQSLPQIGLATSTDGINWTKHNDPTTEDAPYAYSDPVLKVGEENDWDAHRVFIPNVIKNDVNYEIWYTGFLYNPPSDVKQQIGYAVSEDGIVWEKYPDNPVFTDPREWGEGIYGGSVLKYGGDYHLWFACFTSLTTQASPQIGYAYSVDMIGVKNLNEHYLQFQLQPNPFTTLTTLSYELNEPSTVQLSVFNQIGQLIYQSSEEQQQGAQQLLWDAQGLAEGIYYYRLKVGDQAANGKMVKVN